MNATTGIQCPKCGEIVIFAPVDDLRKIIDSLKLALQQAKSHFTNYACECCAKALEINQKIDEALNQTENKS